MKGARRDDLQYASNAASPAVYAWRDATRTRTRSIYEDRTVEYTVDVPIYGTRTVEQQYEEYVWIAYDTLDGASSSGGTVGATGTAEGYWKKMTLTPMKVSQKCVRAMSELYM